MQGFVEFMALSVEDAKKIRAMPEGVPLDMADIAVLVLQAPGDIASVQPTMTAGLCKVDDVGGEFYYALGTVEEIRDKIAAAQAAPERPLFEKPRVKVSGWGGTGMNAYEKQRVELFDWHTYAQRAVLDLTEEARNALCNIVNADVCDDKAAASKAHDALRRLRAKMDAVSRAFEGAR